VSPPARKPHVLIVDDETRIVDVFGKLFDNGWDVETQSDPIAALAHLVGVVEYDAIVLDVVMADLNGINLFLKLKRMAPNRCKRIVFITGNADPCIEFFEAHGCLWIEKPFIDGRLKQLHALVDMMATSDLPRGP